MSCDFFICIVVAKTTVPLSLVFPSLVSAIYSSNMFLHGTDQGIYQVTTIACEAVFQFKSNLNVFKGAVIIVIIYLEIVAAFLPLFITVKRTR